MRNQPRDGDGIFASQIVLEGRGGGGGGEGDKSMKNSKISQGVNEKPTS